jgi:hypothetical protein
MRAIQTAQAVRVKAKIRAPAAQVGDIDFLGMD